MILSVHSSSIHLFLSSPNISAFCSTNSSSYEHHNTISLIFSTQFMIFRREIHSFSIVFRVKSRTFLSKDAFLVSSRESFLLNCLSPPGHNHNHNLDLDLSENSPLPESKASVHPYCVCVHVCGLLTVCVYCKLQNKSHFSIENHAFQGCFLHSLWIFNRMFREKLAFVLPFAVPPPPLRFCVDRLEKRL